MALVQARSKRIIPELDSLLHFYRTERSAPGIYGSARFRRFVYYLRYLSPVLLELETDSWGFHGWLVELTFLSLHFL